MTKIESYYDIRNVLRVRERCVQESRGAHAREDFAQCFQLPLVSHAYLLC